MYPVAGVIVWIALGAMVGWFAGKMTHTSGPAGVGANAGVGILAAMCAGFITTALSNGDKSSSTLVLSIVLALGAACAAVAIFRLVFPDRSPRFRQPR